MNKWTLEFDMDSKDTYKNNWIFHMKRDTDIPVIESVQIAPARQGCPGHPKTIEALVRNMPVDQMDLDALQRTTCLHVKSCGMNLADCVFANKAKAEPGKG